MITGGPRRVVGALIVVLMSAAGSAHAASGRAGLFRGGYDSTAVTKHGGAHPLFEGDEIRLRFSRGDEADGMGWRAECNYFGARVRITGERLRTGLISTTDMFCGGVEGRQDEWLARFIGADPKWRRAGPALRLTAGARVIELRRHRAAR